MDRLYLATYEGLVITERHNAVWKVVRRVLPNEQVTCVIARDGVILAGTVRGIQRSVDDGNSWQAVNDGLTYPHVRWLAYGSDGSDTVLAGTEPAGIFVLRNGGTQWTNCPEVETLRDKHGWMLPYSPEAGCIRGFSSLGQRHYAAAEVGGVLRSDDGGRSWELVAGSDGNPDLAGPPEPFIYPDIHDVAVHPTNENLVFAATGGGLYRSDDSGTTWKLLYDCYCRGLWLDPADPEHLIFGPADHVGAVGRVESTYDGGKTWSLTSDGLNVPWPDTMPERMVQLGDNLLVVLDDGRLLNAPLATLQWEYILKDVDDVNAVVAG